MFDTNFSAQLNLVVYPFGSLDPIPIDQQHDVAASEYVCKIETDLAVLPHPLIVLTRNIRKIQANGIVAGCGEIHIYRPHPINLGAILFQCTAPSRSNVVEVLKVAVPQSTKAHSGVNLTRLDEMP
jgi:hypothetical protein